MSTPTQTVPPQAAPQETVAPPPEGELDAAQVFSGRAGELDLFAFFLLLRANLLRVVLCALVGGSLMLLYAVRAKPRFTATATLIIPKSNVAAASLALQVASGVDLLGGGNELYIDILRSHAVLSAVVRQMNLTQHYHLNALKAELALKASMQTRVGAEGLLSVTVTDEDPRFAAAIANALFAQLDVENEKLSVGSASQERRYYEAELVKEKDALAQSEGTLQQLQSRTGLLEPQAAAAAGLGAVEGTRAALRARQVELAAISSGATAQNPDVVRLKGEIASLERQVGAMQASGASDLAQTPSRGAAQAITLVRAQRDVKFHESIYATLEKQYEGAKEQEAKDFSSVQVLDKAEVPATRSWPSHTFYTLLGLIGGAVLGLVYGLLKAIVRTILRNPYNRERYQALVRNKPLKPVR